MACLLYRKDESGEVKLIKADAKDVSFMLSNGYFASPEEAAKVPTKGEADKNKSGVLSDKEIKAAAKEVGIKVRGRKIEDIKKDLGYE